MLPYTGNLSLSPPKYNTLQTELFQKLKNRDAKAFEELYDRYASSLLAVIKTICGNNSASHTLLKKAFLSFYRQIDHYDPDKGSLFTWMLNISRKLAAGSTHHGKKESVHRIYEQSAPGAFAEICGLEPLILQLDEPCRSILAHAYFEKMTDDEIAEHLETPVAEVKACKLRGLIFLRKMISR